METGNSALILAGLTLAAVSLLSLEIALGMRRMTPLGDLPSRGDEVLPGVSVVIAARNEERFLEQALASVLALDYPSLEVIVVDDRSTDDTGAILDRMERSSPGLRVLHVETLPPGWLGKTHALHRGAAQACGAYLLFTDADVTMEKSTLRRTVNHMVRAGLDHLCLVFRAQVPGGLLNALILEFGVGLAWMFKPWKARDPRSRRHIGVGAFNLIRKEAYDAIGGHGSVALCPVDDIMLGRRIKTAGYRQECLLGYEYVSVPWYASMGELARGLEKNVFAGYGYSAARFVATTFAYAVVSIWPLCALFLSSGPAWLFNALIVAVRSALLADAARRASLPLSLGLWSPITPWILVSMSSRAVLKTLVNKGITWRGTFYSLNTLREACSDAPPRGRPGTEQPAGRIHSRSEGKDAESIPD